MTTLLGILQVFICVVLIFLILMHSGKDAGLSGAFGVGTGAGPFGGGSLVERNLNRWTIGFAIAFAVNTILLLKAPWN
jgi:preprotein translocase subunit SecG